MSYNDIQNSQHKDTLCYKSTTRAFQNVTSVITKSFRTTFFPIRCPAISTNEASELVLEGYFCKPNQILVKNDSSNITTEETRGYCSKYITLNMIFEKDC